MFVDEAHRSVAKDLETYLMAALQAATIIGFTGTPIAKTAHGEGTFKIFGADDERGYVARVLDLRIDRRRNHSADPLHAGAE